MGRTIEEARLLRYDPRAREAVEQAHALAKLESQPLHPLHLFSVLIRRYRQGDEPLVIEGLVTAQLETMPLVADPKITDHFFAILDDAERRAGQGTWITALHLEDALKDCTLPKVAMLAEDLARSWNWEPSS